MKRRDLLTGAAGLSFVASMSMHFGKASAKPIPGVLRFVPNGDLSNFDPISGTAYVVRNGALLVWDTLYGVDTSLVPQRQMIESEEVSSDGLTWTFTLRPKLTFHDGAPVKASDVVASLRRWSARDAMGQLIVAAQKELVVIDDRTFRWALTKPFPKMKYALGKSNAPCAFIMPERIASTDPFKTISDYVGSGPMKFVTGEWKIGAKAVFERFKDYVPREEPGSWMAGGKRIAFDRIEWIVLPDPATAAAALQNGEVDWIERPLNDLLPMLAADAKIKVGIANSLGNVSGLRFNHLQPPFDDVRVRRAILMALSQEDYMQSMFGDQREMWKPMNGYFTPGTALYNENGGEILKGQRNIAAAKALIAASGYKNEPIVMMVAQDQASDKAMGEVTQELLGKKLGMNVNYVATDFGSIQKRRQLKTPAADGGWHMFFVSHAGTDCVNPAAYIGLRANGEKAWFGWPKSEAVEAAIADWYNAADMASEKTAADRINAAALDDVVFAPTGFFLAKQAWRADLKGVVPGPFPVFWDVTRSA